MLLELLHADEVAEERDLARQVRDLPVNAPLSRRLAAELEVVGLLNVQYAVKDGEVYVIEANPRASRTVPFVSKATGVPLAKVAARVMLGATFAELRDEGLLRAYPLVHLPGQQQTDLREHDDHDHHEDHHREERPHPAYSVAE